MRRTWLPLLALLACALPMAATAGLDNGSDSFGVYFDTLGNVNTSLPMTAVTKTVWVLLINPTTAIKGFELAYEIVPNPAMAEFFADDLLRLTSVVQGTGFVDLGAMGEFANTGDWRVGYGTARPATPVMAMVRMTFRYFGEADLGMQFFLTGVKSGASLPGGLPAVLNEANIVRPASLSSGSPLLPVACTVCFPPPPPPPTVPVLTIDINASSNGFQDSQIRAATATTATDNYDGGVDIPKPTPPPGNYVVAGFEHQDWPLGPRFGTDVRASFFPNIAYRIWPLMVETDQVGDVSLSFAPNFDATSGTLLYLKDLQTGQFFDLFPSLSFVFTNNGLPNTYRFELIVGAAPVPPALSPTSRAVPAGWSMVGLPLTPNAGATVGTTMTDPPPGYAFAYNYARATGYRNLSPTTAVTQGTGYWLATDAAFTWSMAGLRDLDGINVPLANGWNLIGNANWFPGPFEGLRVILSGVEYDWLTAAQMGLVSTDVQSYDTAVGTYVDAVDLQPWYGYWINALQDNLSLRFYWGNFVMLPKRLTTDKSEIALDDASWQAGLTLVDAADQSRTVTLGRHADATAGFDPLYDKPQPPRSPAGGPLLMFHRPEWELASGTAFSRDLVNLQDEVASWTVVLSSPNPGRAILTWSPKEWPADVDFQLYLPHENRVAIMSMRKQTSYAVNLGSLATQVVIRTPNFTSGVDDPVPAIGYAMSVSPNPFNPQTTVAFDLPAADRAEVRIYSVRGELVAVLGGGSYTAGHHREIWRGTDRQGHDVPSGSYFARLYVEGQAQGAVTKMSLVR